jgi:transcription antitermination factor NusG
MDKGDDGMNWYVICTKPKWEQRVYEALKAREHECYCPTYSEVRQWSDRKKKIRRPYFNSYVFVRLNEEDRNLVFRVRGVLRYLFWQGRPARVPDPEMEELRHYLNEDTCSSPLVERLTIGKEVCVKRGLLKGQPGRVERIGARHIQLTLPALGYRITVRTADLVA